MVKFRVPSASLASVTTAPADHVEERLKQHVTAHRLRARKQNKAKQAAKRAEKSRQVHEPCIAYVGRISPQVSEKQLASHFSTFGTVLSARIHCCGGVAMTVKPPSASYLRNMPVRQYGIVIFDSKTARRKACKSNAVLGGQQLVVSIAISDLPEVQEKIKRRMDDYESRLEPMDVHRALRSLKFQKCEPTVLIDTTYETGRRLQRQARVGETSFQNTIM